MYRNHDREGSARVRLVPLPEARSATVELENVGSTSAQRVDAEAPTRPEAAAVTPPPTDPTARQTPLETAPALAKQRPRRSRSRKLLLGAVSLLALGVAGWYGYDYVTVGRFMVSTDDAYVQAYNTTLAAKVPGYIASVPVSENTLVHTGDVIATIDDGDYKLAVDSAREKVSTQEATITRMAYQIAAQEAAVEQAKTQLTAAKAAATRAELELNRQNALVAHDWSSRQLQEQAQANRDQAIASVRGAEAAILSAAATVEVLKGQRQEAISTLNELKTALAKAERDLDFTDVRAPVDGTFSNRMVNVGDYINVGQRLANVVPLDDVFIDANFKETQLKRIRPGQPVTISVDAYGHRKFSGIVDSISPAAGSVFTLLPPDNATGNFTKIVQRLPVRIKVPKDVARQNLLRAGMSVYATVDTNKGADDADNTADLDSPLMIHPQ